MISLLGFIVVAACVMTFEARDRAAKFMSNQLKIMGSGGVGAGGVSGGTASSHRGHGRQTPSAGYLSRGDSGRSSYQNPCDAARKKMNKSPSAPNLVAASRSGPGVSRLPARHKHTVHLLSSGAAGRALLSPHALRRQAMSVDTQDYNPLFSPPRSRHSSFGLLTCTTNNNSNSNNNNNTHNPNNANNCGVGGSKQGGGGGSSRESVNGGDPRSCRASLHGSMVLDLHVPNECPVTMRVRDRSRRSDTARRHLLRRQTPVELDDAIIAYAATTTADHRRAKRCTRSATCDVPHAVKSKRRRRQDSSCSDVLTRRRSGSPVCGGGVAGGWRSSANDVVDTAEWARTAGRSNAGGSAASSPRRFADHRHQMTPAHDRPPSTATGPNITDSKMSLSRTCSDIMSIDKSFEESNYSSS